MWVNQKYADRYPTPASPAPPQDDGEVLGTFPRSQGREELRVVLKTYQGHPYVSIRVWERDQAGAWWPVRGKGVSVRIGEAADVAEALASAARITGGSNPAHRGAERREVAKTARPSGPPRGHRN